MENASALPLAAALSARIRALREQYDIRQDEVAAAARLEGLGWSRATVAMIEAGRRHLSIGEFLLLPHVFLGSWVQHVARTADTQRRRELLATAATQLPCFELADFIPEAGEIALTAETFAHPEALRDILRGQACDSTWGLDTPKYRQEQALLKVARASLPQAGVAEKRIWSKVWPEAKVNAATRLTIELDSCRDVEQKAAYKLGVPPLAVAIAAYKLWGHSLIEERDRRIAGQASSRTLQARRGHITRALLVELEPVVVGVRGTTLPEEQKVDISLLRRYFPPKRK